MSNPTFEPVFACRSDPRATLKMLRTRRIRRARSRLTVQMTPLIDVIFNLLIFLLVGSALQPAEGHLSSRLPRSSGQSAEMDIPLEPITIQLLNPPHSDQSCTIVLTDRFGLIEDFEHLYQQLAYLHTQPGYGGNSPVIIVVGDRVSWGDLVDAENAAVRAGFNRVAFAQSPELFP